MSETLSENTMPQWDEKEVARRVEEKRRLVEKMAGSVVAPRSYIKGCGKGSRKQTNEERELRFWSLVEIKPSGCWEWKRRFKVRRYGSFTWQRKTRQAHMVAWILTFGEPPIGSCGLHRCDNTWCVRPDHIFIGTQAENVADMHKKGRQNNAVGSNSGQSKLIESQVSEIKKMLADGIYERIIAAKFNVARVTINHIHTGRTWKHVL
jgi:hypothetical protein